MPTRKARTIFLVAAMVYALTGCALSNYSHVDVATPSNEEFIEFDAVVNVPLATAYQNILNHAPVCWRTPFSGAIMAYLAPEVGGTSQVSFIVPGKLLGSRVELATVRLTAQDESHTHIVGSSFVYPGTWRLAELTDWTNTAPGICSTSVKSVS